MGNYNATPTPDVPRLQVLCRNSNLLTNVHVLSDEWPIDANNSVASFHDGKGIIGFKIKFDPTLVSLT